MGIRHLTTFLRPYAVSESLDGKQVVIDGPSFAHQIYYICLRASSGAQNALEAAPSYEILVDTALAWLDTIRASNVEIKKIYFDGFLPPAKLGVRLQRLQNSTYQLTRFHQSNNEPCRSSFPQPNSTPPSLFQNTAVRSRLTALPPMSFVVPAILEALKASDRYADITDVVPGEADLYCARHLKNHGGVVFTSDSDLLVHDLGQSGAVSFFHDIESSEHDASGILRTQIFQPTAISDRLILPKSHGLHSLAFEISMDAQGTFPKLLTQAQSLRSVTTHSKIFEDFLKEYAPLSIESDLFAQLETLLVLQRLDPRTSEYVLHFSSLARIAGQPPISGRPASLSPQIFLPFLLDCPVRTNAWEVSTATRQLAYGLVNLIIPASEQASTVFEHRRQTDKSDGRELMLPEVSGISEACVTVMEILEELKKKLPNFSERQLWMAFAIHQDIEWSTSNAKTAASQLFLQRLAYPKISDPSGYFGWDIVQFFAQVQGSLYSLRILQQIASLVASTETKNSIPEAVLRLNSLLSSVPKFVDYPDLRTAVSTVRMSEQGLRFMRDLKDVIKVLDYPPSPAVSNPSKSRKSSKKKRKRGQAASGLPASKAKPSNPFALLESG
ncbi:XPG domain containing-domain-containing protein [Rhexocercosporidium sp. MPI-PUGE-AT-0058]|nr:XPG domain containing-domain-containing protein [Rhexocercosporidium sp. MPI-PUGE-AT-0058]